MPEKEKDEEHPAHKYVMWGIYGVLAIIILIVLFGSFYVVQPGERAILLTFGNPSPTPYTEGLHFKMPIIQEVVKMDVKTQKYETDASASSKDLQIVSAKIAINYHLTPESVPNLYKTIGVDYQNRVIQPAVQEVVKASTAQFTAEELITRRPEVKDKIKELLEERMAPRDIIVEDVLITNFDFSEEFNKAIESKVTAEQLKLKADNDLQRIKVEAEQIVTTATANAEALRLQKQEVTPDLVKLKQLEVEKMAIDKWNGILPQVTGGALPFLDTQQYLTQSVPTPTTSG